MYCWLHGWVLAEKFWILFLHKYWSKYCPWYCHADHATVNWTTGMATLASIFIKKTKFKMAQLIFNHLTERLTYVYRSIFLLAKAFSFWWQFDPKFWLVSLACKSKENIKMSKKLKATCDFCKNDLFLAGVKSKTAICGHIFHERCYVEAIAKK